MFDFLFNQPSHEYSQLENMVYSFIYAFAFSSLIALTHRLTYTGEHYPRSFFQSLILGGIVTTMVMMAIGDSLARGLGVFGAMAIIRFRTRIDDSRDIVFLFAALSIGTAIGSYGVKISFAGTALFCLISIILHLSSFRGFTYDSVIFFILRDELHLDTITTAIKKYCQSYKLDLRKIKGELIRRFQFV